MGYSTEVLPRRRHSRHMTSSALATSAPPWASATMVAGATRPHSAQRIFTLLVMFLSQIEQIWGPSRCSGCLNRVTRDSSIYECCWLRAARELALWESVPYWWSLEVRYRLVGEPGFTWASSSSIGVWLERLRELLFSIWALIILILFAWIIKFNIDIIWFIRSLTECLMV